MRVQNSRFSFMFVKLCPNCTFLQMSVQTSSRFRTIPHKPVCSESPGNVACSKHGFQQCVRGSRVEPCRCTKNIFKKEPARTCKLFGVVLNIEEHDKSQNSQKTLNYFIGPPNEQHGGTKKKTYKKWTSTRITQKKLQDLAENTPIRLDVFASACICSNLFFVTGGI